MKPTKYSWIVFGILLLIAAVLGSLSGVNSDGIPNFGASVRHGFEEHDTLLIIAAIISVVLLLWLLLVFVTRLFGRSPGTGDKAGS